MFSGNAANPDSFNIATAKGNSSRTHAFAQAAAFPQDVGSTGGSRATALAIAKTLCPHFESMSSFGETFASACSLQEPPSLEVAGILANNTILPAQEDTCMAHGETSSGINIDTFFKNKLKLDIFLIIYFIS